MLDLARCRGLIQVKAPRTENAPGKLPTMEDVHGFRKRALIRTSATAASMAILVVAATQTAQAQDAAKVLKGMSDYTATQKSISASFDSDIE
jgi:hypothetical protein